MACRIREVDPASISDIQAITDIYNASVIAGGATADLTPRTLAQRRAWVESHKPPYAVFVVEVDAPADASRASISPNRSAASAMSALDRSVPGKAPKTGGEENRRVIAFGAISVFYDRAGYDGVSDLAYYIDPAWQGQGVGTRLLGRLLDECRKRRMRKACGIIFADNAGSIALMRKFGFTRFGYMPAAATDSTGTMRDMSYWYLDL